MRSTTASSPVLTVNLFSSTASGPGGWSEAVANFENVYTGDGSDYVIGSFADNVIDARAGNDTLLGLYGNDTIYGGAATT
ncbi:hypothetical protein [Defluviicoccus vanus]|uniref:hypothetical protein n=1 Tax=Defluviicoccus vanus TaxID=111831 RepID=UPI0038992FC3